MCTIISHENQRKNRMAPCGKAAHHLVMTDFQFAADRLKALREESGLSIQEVADALSMPKSTYAAKEDRSKFKKSYMDQTFVEKLASVFERKGIERERTWTALAGIVPAIFEPSSRLYEQHPGAAAAADARDVKATIVQAITADPDLFTSLQAAYRQMYAEEAVVISDAELVALVMDDYAELITECQTPEERRILANGFMVKQRGWLRKNKGRIGA